MRILKGKRESLWRKRSKETNPEIKDKITHEIDDLKVLIKKVNKERAISFEAIFCIFIYRRVFLVYLIFL